AAPAPGVEQPRAAAPVITRTNPNVVAKCSSYCGGLTSWQLTDKRYEHDATRGELMPARAQMTMRGADGKRVPVPAEQLVGLPDCGAFDVNFASSTYVIPRSAVWTGEEVSKTAVRYTYASDQLEVVKLFTVMPDKYLVRMELKITVRVPQGTEARQQLAVTAYAFQDPSRLEEASSHVTPRVWASGTLRDGTLYETDIKALLEWPRLETGFPWTGYEHPYLLAGYAPRGELVQKYTSAADGKGGLPRGFMRTDLLFSSMSFRHGDAAMTKEIVGYLGPKNYDDLLVADAAAGFPTGFDKVIDLGWFAFLGRPLLWLLQKFQAAVGNWGIAIILLTFLVKAATLYWTTKSMRSMKAMAALAPQMKVLQTKYANDKQRQQTETMALYKEHSVNPVAGCLPILLQMPIWLALYKMLSTAGELYLQPFIPGWINDLTATDHTYVLPGILVATMFLQARLQPVAGDSTQQKFLQYGMPLMFGAMSLTFPAGLTLYMFTNTVLSALHSIYMNKFDKKSLVIAERLKKNQEAAAAALATPVGGAKGAAKAAVVKPAKRVIDAKASVVDAKATEVSPDEADDAADDSDEEPTTGTSSSGAARNRPRRKKRRR
ncbi:MAG: membrane protein insertase YidC, partial [Myxococcales bacterium]|nr:membrane protein insertase YidC [Myxococcales bacterium]